MSSFSLRKYASMKGIFVPKNIEKYVGKNKITYRSSWEWSFMRFCDENPSIIHWASESISIPYLCPITNKQTIYIPDFFIEYVDKAGNKHQEIVEIKPAKQTFEDKAKTFRDKRELIRNLAKWKAANEFCRSKGIIFRILNENDMFM